MLTVQTPHLDKAREHYHRARAEFIPFCIELAAAYRDGEATQAALGLEFDMAQETVSHTIKIGEDERILGLLDLKVLPASSKVIYLLTTLDDAGFEALCRPETTQKVILDFKRLSAPSAQKSLPLNDQEDTVAKPKKDRPPSWSARYTEAAVGTSSELAEWRDKVLTVLHWEKIPDASKITVEESEQIREALVTLKTPIEEIREEIKTLPEKAQQKLERLERRLIAKLEAEFDDRVHKAAIAAIPEQVELYRKSLEEANRNIKDYGVLRRGVKAHLDGRDYKFLLNVLHPDRDISAEDRQGKVSEAFRIVKTLAPYIEALERREGGLPNFPQRTHH